MAHRGEVKKRTQEKIADIERRIRTLQRIRRVLKKVYAACEGERIPISECPILEALDKEGR